MASADVPMSIHTGTYYVFSLKALDMMYMLNQKSTAYMKYDRNDTSTLSHMVTLLLCIKNVLKKKKYSSSLVFIIFSCSFLLILLSCFCFVYIFDMLGESHCVRVSMH